MVETVLLILFCRAKKAKNFLVVLSLNTQVSKIYHVAILLVK